jgi:hypothetical protein
VTTGRRTEGGAATAEMAVALPSLVLVLAIALAAVDLGVAQVRCVDAARLGARLLARGEAAGPVLAEVRAAAPAGAAVTMATERGRVSVVVTGRLPMTLRRLGTVPTPSSTAVARLEVPR